MRTFSPFGADHVAALAATALAGVLLCRTVRGPEKGVVAHAVRWGLATLLLLSAAATRWALWSQGRGGVPELLPLHVCNFQVLLAALALLTLDRRAAEVLYFWAFSATLLAMLTPDLPHGFPDWRYFSFFGLHGGVILAALVLTFGFGLRPRPGGALRALGLLAVYACIAAGVNVALDANYLYLRRPPEMHGPIDWLGPWPFYVVVVAVAAVSSFLLLELPWRAVSRR